MFRIPRRSIPTRSPLIATAPRGITASDVDRAADQLLRAGQRPTIERVRATIGRGSPNTINPLLDAWWQRLAGRLDAGPAALHRLPEPVLHAAEGLWMTAMDDARRRAATEQGSSRSALARDRQELEVRSHVLSIRESELQSRVEQAERRSANLELEVAALTTLLRKEQASRLATEQRLVSNNRAPRPPRRGGLATLKPTAASGRVRSRAKAKVKSKTRQTTRMNAPKTAPSPAYARKQPRKTARTTTARRPTLNGKKRTRR